MEDRVFGILETLNADQLSPRTEAGWRGVDMMVDSRGGSPTWNLPLVA